MSVTEERIPRSEAIDVAEELIMLISDACTRWLVCGSIRRKAPTVKDIELVVEPISVPLQAGLFDVPDGGAHRDLLHDRLSDLRDSGVVHARLDKNHRVAWGEKYKRLVYRGVKVDLFAVTPPAQWGVIATIRTGPAEFSHRLVTSKGHGGLLPYGHVVKDGAIRTTSGTVIATPTEQDVFEFLGIAWIAPGDRR